MEKILWCITGAGHLLEESINYIEKISEKFDVDIALSGAGLEVLKAYGLFDVLSKYNLLLEKKQGKSSPVVGSLKKYKRIVVAPCTANTAAKVVNGISDTLITNIIAQALKVGIPVSLLPTDQKRVEKTKTPSGKEIRVYCRKIDLENVKRMKKMKEIEVIKSTGEINI